MALNRMLVYIFGLVIAMVSVIPGVSMAWSNGGYTSESEFQANEVAIGTHDFIAGTSLNLVWDDDDFSLDWLINNDDALRGYLYGTEFPDNPSPYGFYSDEFGDTTNHHVYFDKETNSLYDCYDDSSAIRSQECYEDAIKYYNQGDYYKAGMCLGMMTHYISDIAVFGHVMGASTPWGSEDSNDHSTFERRADTHIQNAFQTYTSMVKYIRNEETSADYSQIVDIMLYINSMTPIYRAYILQSLSNISESNGGIAPYYLTLQLGRLNTFGFEIRNYTPSPSNPVNEVFTYQSVTESVSSSGDVYYTYPAPYIAYNFDSIDIEDAIASEIAMAVAVVQLALEQFPTNPEYTTISGETNTETSLIDEPTRDIGKVFGDVCGITGGIIVMMMLVPSMVVITNRKQ